MYHLLTRDTDELISKFYFAQKRKPVKDDWALTVKDDMKDIDLGLTEEKIKGMKKYKFMKILKEKIINAALSYLKKIKIKHSKMDILHYNNIKLQEYFKNKKY